MTGIQYGKKTDDLHKTRARQKLAEHGTPGPVSLLYYPITEQQIRV